MKGSYGPGPLVLPFDALFSGKMVVIHIRRCMVFKFGKLFTTSTLSFSCCSSSVFGVL